MARIVYIKDNEKKLKKNKWLNSSKKFKHLLILSSVINVLQLFFLLKNN